MHGVLAQEGGPIEAVFGSFETNALWVILGDLARRARVRLLPRPRGPPAPEGSPKMKEIATAIQVGAKAYLSRQFRTVGDLPGDPHGRPVLRAPGLRETRPTGSSRSGSAARSPSSWAPGSARSPAMRGCGSRSARTSAPRTPPGSRGSTGAEDRVPRRRRGRDVHGRARSARGDRDPADLPGGRDGRPGRVRLRRRAARDVHAGRRRDLHEGRRRRRRPRRQGRARDPRGRPAQRGRRSPTTSATTSATAPGWPPTCSSPTR